jgi:hypothetical protein
MIGWRHRASIPSSTSPRSSWPRSSRAPPGWRVSEPQLEDDDLLRSLRLSTVGVTHRVRDRIMQDDVRMAGWRRWFKNPAAPYDWGSWSSFSAKAKAAHLEGQNVLVSASYGGALLFSPPTLEPGLEVLPAPGIPWMLAESLTSPNPTSSDSGVLVSTEPDAPEAAVGRFLLGDLGHGMFLAGSADEGKAGTTYPAEEVVAVAERHPAVDGASVVVNRGVRTLNSARIVLLLFVDPASDPRPSQGRLIQEVEESLRVEMGQDNLPDQLRVYPLAPRLTEDGGLDHDWCRWQFLTGQLQMKASDELFRLTSLARRLATPSPA